MHITLIGAILALLLLPAVQTTVPAAAPPEAPATPAAPSETYDPALAAKFGADEFGMRAYVLVILKSGPNRMPAGPERDEMFKGHFANMKRLSDEGQLALAGPLDGVDGWRGLFILAAKDVEDAKQIASTDPVLKSGEMIAEYHTFYGSAALMGVRDVHGRIAKKQM